MDIFERQVPLQDLRWWQKGKWKVASLSWFPRACPQWPQSSSLHSPRLCIADWHVKHSPSPAKYSPDSFYMIPTQSFLDLGNILHHLDSLTASFWVLMTNKRVMAWPMRGSWGSWQVWDSWCDGHHVIIIIPLHPFPHCIEPVARIKESLIIYNWTEVSENHSHELHKMSRIWRAEEEGDTETEHRMGTHELWDTFRGFFNI